MSALKEKMLENDPYIGFVQPSAHSRTWNIWHNFKICIKDPLDTFFADINHNITTEMRQEKARLYSSKLKNFMTFAQSAPPRDSQPTQDNYLSYGISAQNPSAEPKIGGNYWAPLELKERPVRQDEKIFESSQNNPISPINSSWCEENLYLIKKEENLSFTDIQSFRS
jgi:hypothetical protein